MEVDVIAYGTAARQDDTGCGPRLSPKESKLTVTAYPSMQRVTAELGGGEWRSGDELPEGKAGCLMSLVLELPEADSYKFSVGGEPLAVADSGDIAELDAPISIGFMIQKGRVISLVESHGALMAPTLTPTPSPTAIPTPRPTAPPTPTPTPLPTGGAQKDGTYRVIGTLTLVDLDGRGIRYISDDLCYGQNGYNDIGPGSQITVRDSRGEIIALTNLEMGGESSDFACGYVFVVDVPESRFYTFSLGRRGDISYSFEDLEDAGWRVDLYIGD
jgi:hypothetical protein